MIGVRAGELLPVRAARFPLEIMITPRDDGETPLSLCRTINGRSTGASHRSHG
jgi:hypothetical protein